MDTSAEIAPSSRLQDADYTAHHHVAHPHDDLPPITTETLPTVRQGQVACQSWDKVSARHPIGSRGNKPDTETFVDLLSTILETRLTDVVKHRLEVKLASGSRIPPHGLDDGWQANKGGGGDSSRLSSEDKRTAMKCSPTEVFLTSTCRSQLRAYVRRIASMYRRNRYHGLEHAVHVTMSSNKLLDMLWEGSVESEDNDTEIDFSVSEQNIVRTAKNNHRNRGPQDQPLQKNGYKFPARGVAAPARIISLSEDFDSQHLQQNQPKPRSSTHLIYSDMFTKFAFVFAAMIHDVDHQGVTNARLALESDPIVELHGAISVAEKHSIKVAFRTLSESGFDEFRSIVFESPDDQLQMHRIVSNVVVSTDIASPERMQSTKKRWEETFAHPRSSSLPHGRLSLAGQSPLVCEVATVQASKPQLVSMENADTPQHASDARHQRRISLKHVVQLNGGQTVEYSSETDDDEDDDEDDDGDNARTALRHSVVIETMLNVADVAHSMQSWELFLFWNRKLFEELYVALKAGRSDNDPSNDWYKNQLGFYRLYVIPLAEKMEKCGVFGERGGEWVKNAVLIRDRWAREGEQVTNDMIASVKRDF